MISRRSASEPPSNTMSSGMAVLRGLVRPALEQREPVGIGDTLEDLELLAAGLLPRVGAAGLVRLRQLRALARSCGDRHHESDRHWHLLGSHVVIGALRA